MAVIEEKGRISLYEGLKSQTVCQMAKIPLTWGGKAQHNVQNVLAAVAACWALGFNASQIKRAVCGFGQDSLDNMGRLEYHDIDGVKVILDYGHNPAGVKEVIRTLKQIKHRKLIGCIGLPGDRSDSIARKLAGEAAQGFDFLYIKEDSDLRGRNPGEIAEMLFQEAISKGKKPSQLKIVLNEADAFSEALRNAQEGDIVVIFYEKAEPIRDILARFESAQDNKKVM